MLLEQAGGGGFSVIQLGNAAVALPVVVVGVDDDLASSGSVGMSL